MNINAIDPERRQRIMKRTLRPPPTIHTALLRPFRLAAVLTIVALVVSLGFLAYTSWTSAQRLDPLERHITHLQDLQQTSIDIQELLIRHVQTDSTPTNAEVARISKELTGLISRGAHLHPDTPVQLARARGFLDDSQPDLKTGLLAALTVIRETLHQENDLQRKVVGQTRKAAEVELAVAAGAMLVLPVLAMVMLAAIRRRAFGSINRLTSLLENVGNLNFHTTDVPADDPLANVYARYNDMAERLREASHAAEAHAESLERQVKVASETLLRQQAELENGSRLAAVGEFSARLAHELRNPISGISAALHNMEEELPDGDERERVRLIADEMERVTGLLNRMLEQGRAHLETPMEVDAQKLVGDIVHLMHYQLPERIAIDTDVAAGTCVIPRDTLRQVLINLIRNSSDALADAAGRIVIRMSRDERQVTLSVADTGPGYPDALLKHGIRPFHTSKADGTGLGMSIIQRLVRSAGGEIQLKRGDDGGALTIVTLPCGD
ncbi:sensor histidine kinase [Nitrogeniibacter aestuarii]|uniref:sensor histidine kinase n=1 Tax=Nitrogeniibacter aestuarii TaxID=2815343 RepID=UPI001E344A3B|nr:HAMP domain-containing sensor histidine kinase [Nitrogeniibacter aestuarii]